jgi:hypothetical protein
LRERDCQFAKPLRIALCPNVIDCNVAPLDQAIFFQALLELLHIVRIPRLWARCIEERDARHAAVLAACRGRPRRSAAEERDELAPLQLTKLHPLPLSGMAA